MRPAILIKKRPAILIKMSSFGGCSTRSVFNVAACTWLMQLTQRHSSSMATEHA